MTGEQIVEIIPADGWKAHYEPESDEVDPYENPIVCWALIDVGEFRKVVGLEAAGQGVVEQIWPPNQSDFSHYVPPTE